MDRALRERIKSNSEFFSGQLSSDNGGRLTGPDGFNSSRSRPGSQLGSDVDEVEFTRMGPDNTSFDEAR